MNDLSLSRRPEVPHSTTIPQQHGPSQSPAIPTQSSGGLVPTCCDDNGYYSSPLQMHCNFHVPLLDWGSRGCGFKSRLVDDPNSAAAQLALDLVAADNGGGSGGGGDSGGLCAGCAVARSSPRRAVSLSGLARDRRGPHRRIAVGQLIRGRLTGTWTDSGVRLLVRRIGRLRPGRRQGVGAERERLASQARGGRSVTPRRLLA